MVAQSPFKVSYMESLPSANSAIYEKLMPPENPESTTRGTPWPSHAGRVNIVHIKPVVSPGEAYGLNNLPLLK